MKMVKKLTALILVLLMLPVCALADGCIINLVDNPDAEYAFQEGADILEAVYVNTHGSDSCILRMNGEVFMIDAGTEKQAPLVVAALKAMGITHIDTAFISHPHDDHSAGYDVVPQQATIGKMLVALPLNFNGLMRRAVRTMNKLEVPIEQVEDGQVLRLGGENGATLTVIQRNGTDFSVNDLSAMLMIQYGDRRLLATGDVENRAQVKLMKVLPECGLKADIMKYPHHGHAPIRKDLYEEISPELVIMTHHPVSSKPGYKFMDKVGTPVMNTYYGCIRLRTDGVIWVVDLLETEISNLK